ncbi:MAG: acylphosphatase [archaeon GB-1867-035]|nr:acylphosphatase [Candidatus Culexmicrobium profundum]
MNKNKVKARIIVKGNVQGVGYRALVKTLATRNQLKGLIRNLKDGSVEIFVEGTKQSINCFLKEIEIKGDPKDPLSLNVEDIELYWEGMEGYKPAWKEYKGFQIDYGPYSFTPIETIMLESLEWSKLHFSHMTNTLKEELPKLDKQLKNINQNITGVQNSIQSMKNDVNESFNTILNKYGEISEKLTTILQTLTNESKTTRETLIQTMKLLREAIEKLSK